MIGKRTLLAAAATLVVPGLLRHARTATPEVTLKLHHFLGPTSTAQVKMLEPWAKSIGQGSDGRVRIEIYPSMTLGGSPAQLFRQAADGVADIVWTANGYTPGLFPRTEAFELPTVFTNDIAATNLAMRALFDEYLAPEYAPVHLLFGFVHAGNAIHMASRPVHAAADVKGRKLRSPGPAANAVVAAMGATPVTAPAPDLPQMLSTHAVDGALIPFEIIPALKLQDVTKYQVEGPDSARFGTTAFQVSMNKDRWAALPPDLKQVFDDACDDRWLRQVARIWRDADDRGIKAAVEHGNEHIVLTDAEMQTFTDALAPVVGRWERGHTGFKAAALVKAARDAVATYRS